MANIWTMQEFSLHDRTDRRWRTGAWTFLAALAIQGLPFGRDLAVSEQKFAEQRHLAALDGATTLGLQNTWLAAVIWSTLYLVAAVAIYKNGQRSFLGALRRQWPLTLLTALVPTSAFWAAYVQPVAMNTVHAIGVTLVAFSASMYYWDKVALLVRHLGIVLGMNLAIQLSSVFLLPLMAISYDGRWSGLTGNANTLGSIAGLTLWANFATVLLTANRVRWLHRTFIIFAIVALYGTNSITATLSSVAAVLGMLLMSRFPFVARNAILFVVLLAPAAFIMAWGGINIILTEFLPALGRATDLTGRISIWSDALRMIKTHPFLGWGFDNNARVIEQTGLATLHFHNGYLDLAVRGGVFSLVLFLLSAHRVALHVRRQAVMNATIAISFILLILIYNFTEVTFLTPRNPLWLVFLCVAFLAVPRHRQLIR